MEVYIIRNSKRIDALFASRDKAEKYLNVLTNKLAHWYDEGEEYYMTGPVEVIE